ncbi:hypothetical protein ACHAXT_005494 [Thalassiosira profunda]
MTASIGLFLLGTAASLLGGDRVSAFLPPSALPQRPSVGLPVQITRSTLAYGPRSDSDEEKDLASASPFSANDFQKQIESQIDPTCPVDDEDCLAFSSLDDQPLFFTSNTNEDPLCDPQDVDCQAFLTQRDGSDAHLAAALQSRSDSIAKERTNANWRTAHCPTTFVSVGSGDWVRRVAMHQWPLAVCGGARGGVYVMDLEAKKVVGKVEGAHSVQVEQGTNPIKANAGANMAKQAMEKLYGKLDGGGVVSVAIHGDLVASSGREGGVRLWRLVQFQELPPIANEKKQNQLKEWLGKNAKLSKLASAITKGGKKERSSEFKDLGSVPSGKLVPLGSIKGLQNTIVTSLKFDSNNLLWAACYDGTVRAYSTTGYDDSSVRFPPKKPVFQSDFTDSVLDMHLCEELKLGVCATADGSAALFNMETGQFFVGIMLFEGVAARSVMILKHKGSKGHSVLCGGADGKIHRVPLRIDPKSGRLDEENPFAVSEATETAIKPRHTGPVMCMTSPDDGIFVSGGQDGALRVWEFLDDESKAEDKDGQAVQNKDLQTKCVYALTGYKLWLSATCTDGKRLISDGGENSVIVRDFSRESGTNGKASL